MESLSTGKHWGSRCPSVIATRIAFFVVWLLLGGTHSALAETVVRKDSEWRYLRGTTHASNPTDAWRQPGFDASAWPEGAAPFHYGDGVGGTTLGDMQNLYSSVYARHEFEVASTVGIVGMDLALDYDDGVIVWLNGVEIARANAPSESPDGFAARGHESGTSEDFPLDEVVDLLVSGNNVLAMQAFNVSLASTDFFVEAKLNVSRTSEPLIEQDSVWRYRRGTEEASSPREAWRNLDFDDSDWQEGATPIGYGFGDENTVLSDMQGNYTTVFMRRKIDVPDLGDLDFIEIRVDIDDSYLLWVNGELVLSGPGTPTNTRFDAVSKVAHTRGRVDELRVNDPGDFFMEGLNVVALQVFNISVQSSDLWAWVEMDAVESVGDTRFSVDRGFFSEAFEVEIATSTPGATIRYTTDGTWPSETEGELYEDLIPISTTTVLRAIAYKDGLEASDVDTQTYVFPADVLKQPERPDDYPTSWPATVMRDGMADYEMDPAIVNHSQYRNRIEDALLSIPTMSLVLDPDHMFGADGVYHTGNAKNNLNDQFERPVSVEMIYPDGSKGAQVNAGLRPHSHVSKKRSFKLAFKKELGAAKLKTDLFGTTPLNSETAADEFDRLVLRAGFNRSWSQDWNLSDTTFVRDQWMRDTQLAVSGFGAHGIFVHLYINGLYWGLYNPSERPDAFFSSTYFGGPKEDWFAVNHNGVIDGSTARYDRAFDLATERKLEDPGPYAEIADLIDLPAFADYLIVNFYGGNGDWPHNNFYAGHRVSPPGPLRFYVWDAEDSWDKLGSGIEDRSSDGAWVHPVFRRDTPRFRAERALLSWAWRALVDNADFMALFSDRVYDLCFRGALTEDAARERWTILTDHIEEAVICESARWGDSVASTTRRLNDHWAPEVRRVHDRSMVGNVSQFLSVLRAEDYYPSANPASFNATGGFVPAGFQLSLVPPQNGGTVYYTTDGTDPREPGGAIADSAMVYDDDPIAIDGPTVVKTRTFRNQEWSAVAATTFYTPQSFEDLRITEIMYNPPDIGVVDGDEFEFVEIKNVGNAAIDLSGLAFAAGITFDFEFGDRLGPDDFLILVRNPTEFGLRYPGVPAHGTYGKQLSNSGEDIVLVDAFANRLIELEYDDSAPWPEEADGDGFSLVPVDSDPGDPMEPSSWRRSADLAGSPGRDDPDFDAPPSPDCNSNGVLDSDDINSGFSADADENGIPDDCVAPPTGPDCNFNGVVDSSDISSGVSADVDGNGIPDECDPPSPPPSPDCNENGVLDADDIQAGTSADTDGNDVPDECDPPPPPSPDCNENGALDAQDIASGVSSDVNGNGIPDECDPPPAPDCNENGVSDVDDILTGTSEDVNENSVPDECDPPPVADCNENGLLDAQDILRGVSRDVNGNAIPDECEDEPPLEFVSFIRGDANRDGRVDVSDAITTVDFVFQGIGVLRCPDATDANDDGSIDLADPIYSVNYFFINGPAPRPPFPSAGDDPTIDLLGPCEF